MNCIPGKSSRFSCRALVLLWLAFERLTQGVPHKPGHRAILLVGPTPQLLGRGRVETDVNRIVVFHGANIGYIAHRLNALAHKAVYRHSIVVQKSAAVPVRRSGSRPSEDVED